MNEKRQMLFGSRRQTLLLMVIVLLEDTYPREISRLAQSSVANVSTSLDRLETQGVIVSRYIGKERRVSLNPRFVARQELVRLIERLTIAEPELMDSIRALRKRPRRRGKEI